MSSCSNTISFFAFMVYLFRYFSSNGSSLHQLSFSILLHILLYFHFICFFNKFFATDFLYQRYMVLIAFIIIFKSVLFYQSSFWLQQDHLIDLKESNYFLLFKWILLINFYQIYNLASVQILVIHSTDLDQDSASYFNFSP